MKRNPPKRLASAILLAASAATAGTAPLRAGEAEIAVIGEIYADPSGSAQRFSRQFLTAVPLGRIGDIIDGLRGQYGPAVTVRETAEGYEIETATHLIPVQITLNAEAKIEGLFFRPAQQLTASLSETLKLLSALHGSVSYAVMRDGVLLHGHDADKAMAVGSAFKLAVLKVLADDIANGTLGWDTVMRLQESDRSLPSGRLQDFPVGSSFTLHTLAAAMIAESDNTATDLLLDLLGREAVAEELGIAPDEMLSTREFFALRADPTAALAWLNAEADARPGIAAEAAVQPPDPASALGPAVPGIEWYLPLEKLCALIGPISDLPLLQLNPGPAYGMGPAAYKGGSEPGVLNFTVALHDAEDRALCVALTVNDPGSIDESAATGAFRALIHRALAHP